MQCLVPHLIEARHINYLEHLASGTPLARQQTARGSSMWRTTISSN
jgi:hypothetical protein